MTSQLDASDRARQPSPFVPLNLAALLGAPRPKLDFVLPGLPAGVVGALVAPGATGKTTLALQLCAAVALGEAALGGLFGPVAAGRSVLVSSEDPLPILTNRLKDLLDWLLATTHVSDDTIEMRRQADLIAALQANMSVTMAQGPASMLVVDGKLRGAAIDALVRQTEGARLVVIDPLRRFHDGDENDSAAATALVQAFESLARRSGAAVLLSHHTSKSSTLNGAGSEQQAARGSSALTDGVRWQANLRVMSEQEAASLGVAPTDRRQFIRFDIPKSNYCAPFSSAWLRRGAGGMQTKCEPEAEAARASRGARKERGRG